MHGDAGALPDQVFSAEATGPGDAGGPPCCVTQPSSISMHANNAFAVLLQATRQCYSLTGPHRTGWSVPMCRRDAICLDT